MRKWGETNDNAAGHRWRADLLSRRVRHALTFLAQRGAPSVVCTFALRLTSHRMPADGCFPCRTPVGMVLGPRLPRALNRFRGGGGGSFQHWGNHQMGARDADQFRWIPTATGFLCNSTCIAECNLWCVMPGLKCTMRIIVGGWRAYLWYAPRRPASMPAQNKTPGNTLFPLL